MRILVRLNEQGRVAIAAHPYRFWSGLGEKNTLEGKFDAVEILNGRSFKKDNMKAKRLSERMGVPGTGGSDAHFPYELGKAWIEVDDDPITSIKKNKLNVYGESRGLNDTLIYVYRSVSLWIWRGFKRI